MWRERMSRRTLDRARVIVTGASSGIGEALARALAHEGAQLVLTARREDRLSSLAQQLQEAGSTVRYCAGDITSEQVRRAVLETARRELGGLDILINNAGVGAQGPLATASPERLRRVMEVNFFAPVELIRAAIPLLRGTPTSDCQHILGTGPSCRARQERVLRQQVCPARVERCAACGACWRRDRSVAGQSEHDTQ